MGAMKKALWITAAVVITASAIGGAAVYFGIDADENALADYTYLGIQADTYEQSETPYLQEYGIGYNWYYEGEKPMDAWNQYLGSNGAMLALDEQGRVRKFMNETDIFLETEKVTEPLSDEELEAKAYAVLEQMAGSLEGYTVSKKAITDKIGTTYYTCYITLEKEYAPGASDYVSVQLTADGKVRFASASYCDLHGNELTTAIDGISASVDDYVAMLLEENPGAVAYEVNVYYCHFNNTLYGCCRVNLADEGGGKWCECAMLRSGEFPA